MKSKFSRTFNSNPSISIVIKSITCPSGTWLRKISLVGNVSIFTIYFSLQPFFILSSEISFEKLFNTGPSKE